MNIETLIPPLCELAAKSTAILLGAWLLERAWLRASAAQRHLIWCAAFAALLLLPFTRFVTPRWAVPIQRVTIVATPPTPLAARPETVLFDPPTPASLPAPWHWPDWQTVALLFWVCVAALLLLRRLLGSLRLLHLRRTLSPVTEPHVESLAAEVFREFHLHRPITLRWSGPGSAPLTWGTFRPVITLPADARAWPAGRVIAALRHEAGHIARADHFTRWLAQLTCILHWPNPLAWLAARRLCLAQEQATDDLVLHCGVAPDDYAAQLFEVARTLAARRGLAALPMATPSTIERRLLSIVDTTRNRRSLTRAHLFTGLAVTLGVLALATAAQLRAIAQGTAAPQVFTGPQIEIETKFLESNGPAETIIKNLLYGGLPAIPPVHLVSAAEFESALPQLLDSARGLDLLTAPRVTTHSGQHALIEIIREFRYPVEWEPGPKGFTPKAFDQRNVGITFGVLPVLLPDNSLKLDLQPEVTEFLGFMDLDSPNKYPVKTSSEGLFPTDPATLAQLPTTHRLQPVFASRKITTTAELPLGQTVILSIPEDAAAAQSALPPRPPRHLYVFVTARLAEPHPSVPQTTSFSDLEAIILPDFNLQETTFSQAISLLSSAAQSHGLTGLQIHWEPFAGSDPRLTVSLKNVPLGEALRYVAGVTQRKIVRFGDTIFLRPQTEPAAPAPVTQLSPLERAERTILPEVVFQNAPLSEVQRFLFEQSCKFSSDRRHVEIALVAPAGPEKRVTMNLRQVPVAAAVRYMAGLVGMEVAPTEEGLIVRPLGSSVTTPPKATALPVPGKPGFVTSPYLPGAGYIDVRDFPSGTEVKDPYTGQIFLVPELETTPAGQG